MKRHSLVSIVALVALAGSAAASEPANGGASTEEHRALMISAQVMRKESKLLRARDLLTSCVSKECGATETAECTEIRGYCEKLRNDVVIAVPTVVVRVRDDRGLPVRTERLELDELAVDPSVPVLVDPGAHVATALYAGRVGHLEFVVEAGKKDVDEIVTIDLKQNVQRRPVPLPVYALGGAAIASGLLALGTGIYTARSYQDLDGCQPYCDPSQETKLRTTGYIADVSTLVAIASAVTGTIWFLARPTVTETRWLDVNAEPAR